ncbi:SH3 domain-containing protein [Myxococcota bacterium]|nr:SH3 domain-containing protein [Myxococcota bacterium]
MKPLPRLKPWLKVVHRAVHWGFWRATLLAGILLAHSVGAVEDPRGSIEIGIATYQEAMRTQDRDERMALFSRAEHFFSDAIERGARNASIETNRANAALQAERRGHAIWGYRRALSIDPSHRPARRNLELARAGLREAVPIPEPGGLADSFFFWRSTFPPQKLKMWAALCFFAACLGLATNLSRPGFTPRLVSLFFGMAWLGLMAPSWIAEQRDTRQTGVLIAEETTARSADARHAPPRLVTPLPAGTEFFIIQDRENWIEIELYNGLRAWVPGSAAAKLDPP